MKVTLDLDTNELIVPKNFFYTIEKQNAIIEKVGGERIKPIDVIKKSFEIAMSNTDKYLHTRQVSGGGRPIKKEEEKESK